MVEFALTADKGITDSLILNETSDKGMLKPEKAFQEIHPFHFHKTLPKTYPVKSVRMKLDDANTISAQNKSNNHLGVFSYPTYSQSEFL